MQQSTVFWSEHPLGKAVVSCYKESCQKNLPAAEKFEMLPGRGVSAVINGKMLLAGNEELMQESGVEEIALMTMCAEAKEYLQQGCTIIYIAVDQKAAGYIRWEMTPTSIGGEKQVSISGGSQSPI